MSSELPGHRLVSLLPGATELVCALGFTEALVGISHECDYPPAIVGLPRVTATPIRHEASSLAIDEQVRAALSAGEALYQLDLGQLRELAPTLLVSQSLCAVCGIDTETVDEVLCALPEAPPQFNFAPSRLGELLEAVSELGERLGAPGRAASLRAALEVRIEAVRARSARLSTDRPRVAFLEWLDPFFAAGHWNPELVSLAGGEPVLGTAGAKSRQIDWDALEAVDASVLFIASCGFPIARTLVELQAITTHPRWPQLRAVREARVFVADGNAYFNRPGPRLVDSLELLAHALHPALHPLPEGLVAAHSLKG